MKQFPENKEAKVFFKKNSKQKNKNKKQKRTKIQIEKEERILPTKLIIFNISVFSVNFVKDNV